MTTIATDGKTIAADGRRTSNGELVSDQTVKLRVVDGVIYGLIGTSAVIGAAIEWHRSGADPASIPKYGDWTLIVISKRDGLVWYHNDMPFPQVMPYPNAFGTGDKYALGALAAGASPAKAVEIATRYDIHSGGRIHVLDIAKETGTGALSVVVAS